MKRTNPEKPPYLSWAMIVRNSATKAYQDGWSYEKCLQSLRERTPDAEIVIVDTMSSDAKTIEISQRYADRWVQWAGPRGNWTTEMAAFDDAAAARRHAFSLTSGTWVGWVDDDDQIPDAAETQRLLKLNGRWREAVAVPGQVLVDVNASVKTPEPLWLTDILKFFEDKFPKVEALVCPYLYMPDGNGLASGGRSGWQERERIIKRRADGSFGWQWKEEGHEIMVPEKVEDFAGMHYLPSCLWVHRKLWTLDEQQYTIKRHFKIIHDKYLNGDRTTRNLIYLAQFSLIECPEKRAGFIQEAVIYSTTTLDRMRAHIEAGNFETERGFYNEAKAHFAAATAFRPDLPDGWLAGADAAIAFEDHAWAIAYFRESLKHGITVESQVNPRAHELETRAKLMQALYKIADLKVTLGQHNDAQALLEEARALADHIQRSPAVGPDGREAYAYMANAHSKADSQKAMLDATALFQLLVRNDETEKALKLIDCLPNTVEDHPLKISMEQWAMAMRLHFGDEEAYFDFYANEGVDPNGSPDAFFSKDLLGRATYAVDWINSVDRNVDVLEIGSYDGVIGAPILNRCKRVSTYTAIDASELALNLFRKRAEKDGTVDRLKTVHAAAHCDWPVRGQFDVVICFEMIEHVPDPVALVRALLDRVRYGTGRLFLSTPWLSYDKSKPALLESRDPRGHVRAMTLRDMACVVETAGGEIEDAWRFAEPSMYGIGDTMHVRAKPRSCSVLDSATVKKREVTFAVPGALWPWNDTLVDQTGMGASESMIVWLARELAKSRCTEVYGPVNDQEVRHGAAYWPVHQLRHAKEGSDLIVSRAPGWTKRYLEAYGLSDRFRKKILWLQDVGYPDLTPEIAAYYDHVVVLSKWHADCVETLNGIKAETLDIIGNFLIPEKFTALVAVKDELTGALRLADVERRPHHFIYSSSPDRGLIPILEMWPAILQEWPDATLDIFYGWTGCKKLSVNNPDWTSRFREVRNKYDALRHQKGIRERGRVNGRQLALEMRSAAVWYYPCYKFLEAGCATAFEARAAGCVPVVPPIAALVETAASDLTQWLPDEAEWNGMARADQVAFTMERIRAAISASASARAAMSAEAIKNHALSVELPKWLELLK